MARSRKKCKYSATHSSNAPPAAESPIHGVPVETLLRILLLYCDENPIEIIDKPVLQHTLLAVCRRWRDLLLKTPQFWRNITFRIVD
jgi:hypothetical protein